MQQPPSGTDAYDAESAAGQDCVTQLPDGTRIFDIHTDALDPRYRLPSVLRMFQLFLIAIMALVCIVLIGGLLSLTLGPGFGFPIGMALTAGFGILLWKLSDRNVSAELSRATADADPVTVARRVAEYYRGRNDAKATKILGQFLDRGWEGMVVRIISRADPISIVPLTVQVEPTEPNQVDENFLQYATTGSGGRAESAEKLLEQSDWERWLRRDPQTKVITAGLLLMLAFAGWHMFTRRQFPTQYYVVGALLIFGFVKGFFEPREDDDVLIVNGGLLVRRSGWFGGGAQYLYQRKSSVMVVHRTRDGNWYWLVGDSRGGGEAYGKGTQMEVEVLLRAWLSPLAPPPIEQLSDPV